MRNYLIVAGEASGDLYGAELAREIRRLDPGAVIWGCGGPRMEAENVEILYPISSFSVLGFSEVAGKIPFFLKALSHMKREVTRRRPAVIVPIDFPGFNIRLADFCSRSGCPVAWYISPQVWAWGRSRVKRLRRIVDTMLVILPFEAGFYRDEGVPVEFTGHPLVDLVRPSIDADEFRRRHSIERGERVVGLFPGSRRHEVEQLLPAMAETVERLKREGYPVRPLIGAVPALDDDFYGGLLSEREIVLIRDGSYDLLQASDFALVASGTMTVEAACIGTPMAVLYKVSPLSWLIGRMLVRIPHVAMVNLLAHFERVSDGSEKEGAVSLSSGEAYRRGDSTGRVVPEFLQNEATADTIVPVVRKWLDDPRLLDAMRKRLADVKRSLGGGGASRRAAEMIVRIAEERD